MAQMKLKSPGVNSYWMHWWRWILKKFELFCRGLLTKMGIDVDDEKGVQYVADGGIDGFGYVRSDDYRTRRVALQRVDRQNGSKSVLLWDLSDRLLPLR